MKLEAGSPVGKYVIKRQLAEGGMAEIYLATSRGPEGFEKEVVIKRVRSFLAGDENFVQMFIAEARLASRLNHANVVQIFDFDKHEDSYYLAMEYVRGCSLWDLRKRCRDKGVRVPPVLVAHIGAQVAAGLHYAHRLKTPEGTPINLVHRDVTPHNVLLSFDGAVKLTDFGIAKAGQTQSGMLKGKFSYMSPEQARGEQVDARTDVFALGIVLWEMLTGGKLFDGDSDIAVLQSVKESVIAPPARLNPDVPEDLDEVLAVALERDVGARFQSAAELERALAQCVLRNATSVDDTDVGAFVRRIFDVPYTQVLPAVMDRSARRANSSPGTNPSVHPERGVTGESPVAVEPLPPTSVPLREPTAVLPGSSASGRGRPVRVEETPEDSLVSASTLVLPRDRSASEPPRSAPSGTQPVPPPARDSHTAVPVREARSMPAITSVSEPAEAKKRLGPGVWVGAAVVGVALIGGAVALVLPGKEAAAPAPAQALVAPAPTAQPSSPPVAEPPPEATPDAGTLVAAASETAAPPAPTEAPAPAAEPAPVVEAKGTLTVRATPYADVYLDGKILKKELQGSRSFQLPPGTYQLTFKHPSSSESYDVTVTSNGTVSRSFRVRRK